MYVLNIHSGTTQVLSFTFLPNCNGNKISHHFFVPTTTAYEIKVMLFFENPIISLCENPIISLCERKTR